ncbi:MAG: thiol oxidoreductase, partial [Sandaracinaceae bacterium]|nr:thiol oxidoreductase [Sandaracinaceae bacterium]
MRAAVAPLVLAALAGCGGVDPDEALSGGDTTVFDASRNAFGLSARNISFERRQRFLVGNSFFTDPWVTAPSSVMTRDGLGPVFNASACAGCHVRDGRGQPPAAGEEMVSMLARISLPGVDAHGGPLAVPGYGGQLQPRSIAGVPAEVRTEVRWDEIEGAYADGTPYLLRRPILDVVETAFGPLPSETQFSLRAAPVVFGLGLLQCVPEEDLLANADEGDADGDGVSGRPNRVWDAVRGRV